MSHHQQRISSYDTKALFTTWDLRTPVHYLCTVATKQDTFRLITFSYFSEVYICWSSQSAGGVPEDMSMHNVNGKHGYAFALLANGRSIALWFARHRAPKFWPELDNERANEDMIAHQLGGQPGTTAHNAMITEFGP